MSVNFKKSIKQKKRKKKEKKRKRKGKKNEKSIAYLIMLTNHLLQL
jgi:hypothetical protein